MHPYLHPSNPFKELGGGREGLIGLLGTLGRPEKRLGGTETGDRTRFNLCNYGKRLQPSDIRRLGKSERP